MSQTLPLHVFALMRAREYLTDPMLWSQGRGRWSMTDGRDQMCVAVAVVDQRYEAPVNVAAFEAIRETLIRRGVSQERYSDITLWNDWHGTSHAELLDVLDETIARESCPAG